MLPLRVQIASLTEVPELLVAFTRAGYVVVQAGQGVIEIHRTPRSDDPHADVRIFLHIWNTMHPDALADVL